MSGWTAADVAEYKAAQWAGKVRTAKRRLQNVGRHKCHICKGGGEIFEAEGWGIATWQPCHLCKGTGTAQGERAKERAMTAEEAMAEIWGTICPDCGPNDYAGIVKEAAALIERVKAQANPTLPREDA